MDMDNLTRFTPVACLAFLPSLVRMCRDEGYTLAVHGSMARDFDLIAIAWTNKAIPATELVQKIAERVGGKVQDSTTCNPYDFTQRAAEPKPHGRYAWTIHIGGGPMIDLSVIGPEPDSIARLMERLDASAQQFKNRQQRENPTL